MSNPFLLLLVGWLLGILSPLATAFLELPLKRRELKKALKAELSEIRFRASCTKYLILNSMGQLDRHAINEQIQLLSEYDSQEAKGIIERLKKLLTSSDEELGRMGEIHRTQFDASGRSQNLKPLQAQFLESNLHSMTMLSANLQQKIFEILFIVRSHNSDVELNRQYFILTYDESIGEANQQIIRGNIDENRKFLMGQYERLEVKISQLLPLL